MKTKQLEVDYSYYKSILGPCDLTKEFQDMTKPDQDLPVRESLPLPLKDANDIKR